MADSVEFAHGYITRPAVYFTAKGVELEGTDPVTDVHATLLIPWDELASYLADFEKGALKYHNEHKE